MTTRELTVKASDVKRGDMLWIKVHGVFRLVKARFISKSVTDQGQIGVMFDVSPAEADVPLFYHAQPNELVTIRLNT